MRIWHCCPPNGRMKCSKLVQLLTIVSGYRHLWVTGFTQPRGGFFPRLGRARTTATTTTSRTSFTDNVTSFRGGAASPPSTQLSSATLGAAMDAFWRAHPLVAAALVCATKATLADLVAQRRQRRILVSSPGIVSTFATPVDWRRTLSFATYGALYQGAVQELIYNNLYTSMFGSATTPLVVAKKVLFDAFFHNALVCIPMAYMTKAVVFGYSIRKGIRQYVDDVRFHGLLFKYYAIWMPVNTILFTLVPTHYRITVMAVISFFWMVILSSISSRSRD